MIDNVDIFGKELSAEQQNFFKNTKVKEDNKLILVYHGTEVEFNEFSYKYMNSEHIQNGPGFYFTTNKSDAEMYGNNVKEYYLNITKPINAQNVSIWYNIEERKKLEKFIREYVDPVGDDMLSNWGDINTQSYDDILKDFIDLGLSSEDSDLNIIWEIAYESGKYNQEFFNKLRDYLGYDGVIINRNDITHYIVFNADQIKLTSNIKPTLSTNIKENYYNKITILKFNIEDFDSSDKAIWLNGVNSFPRAEKRYTKAFLSKYKIAKNTKDETTFFISKKDWEEYIRELTSSIYSFSFPEPINEKEIDYNKWKIYLDNHNFMKGN